MESMDKLSFRQSLALYRLNLREDLRAHGLISWRPWYALQFTTLDYQRTLRLCEFFGRMNGTAASAAYTLSRLSLKRKSIRLGVSIPPFVFGPGLSIAHYGSIVVNDGARVGAYCRIHSATNIGVGKGGAPKVGDFSYIGPGAVISGGITIADRVCIGANAVVLRSINEACTVAGAPARKISDSDSAGVMPVPIAKMMTDQ